MFLPEIIAEPVRGRLQHGERMHIGLLLRGVRASWRERNLHVVAGLLSSGLHGCATAQNNQVGKRDLLSTGLRAVEIRLDRLKRLKNLRQLGRLVDFPILLRREADARAVSPAPLVAPAECRC